MQPFNLLGVDRQWNLSIDGRKSNSDLWNSINWKKVKQIVNRLQTRIVKAVKEYCRVLYGALSMLEPCEVKVSRRGEGSRKAAALPKGLYCPVRLIRQNQTQGNKDPSDHHSAPL